MAVLSYIAVFACLEVAAADVLFLHPPTITVRRRRAADVARNELEAGRMVDKSTSENRGHRHSLGCSSVCDTTYK
jgi:hypothetical protein